MNIYTDYDDCLCETAYHFSGLAAELFGIDVPYEKIRYFDLQKSFSLTDEQFTEMMIKAHSPEVLLSYEETPGAIETVNSWVDDGYDVSIITGRPYSAYDASREWLDRHGLERVRLYCLNKYGRDSFTVNSEFSLEVEDYYRMRFDYAIEDSPSAFRFFEHLPQLKVMVYDRPWNQECVFPGENYRRCHDWQTIRKLVVPAVPREIQTL
ncbi:MAG: 2-dehydropantoate 2-reductase [Lachnospiraceae bacterium]|nr:2-dehydropantoate 2-reductase [Lachnospiraceae bacterium]